MSNVNGFGSDTFDHVPEDALFLPEIDPEEAVGWSEEPVDDFEDYRYEDEILSSLEAAYGITHFDYYDNDSE